MQQSRPARHGKQYLYHVEYYVTRADFEADLPPLGTAYVWGYDPDDAWQAWDDSNEDEGFYARSLEPVESVTL